MELLKILAIFLLVFYGLKYLFRLLMPFALRKMTERLMNKAQEQQSAGGGRRTYYYTTGGNPFDQFKQQNPPRSEERRVGKECRCWWGMENERKKRYKALR